MEECTRTDRLIAHHSQADFVLKCKCGGVVYKVGNKNFGSKRANSHNRFNPLPRYKKVHISNPGTEIECICLNYLYFSIARPLLDMFLVPKSDDFFLLYIVYSLPLVSHQA